MSIYTLLYLHPDLAGPGLMEQHCMVEHIDGVVMLHPKQGECYINSEEVSQPAKLNQGQLRIESQENYQ